MTGLRHQILDDDRVLVVATGDRPVHFHITTAEAKRFAWSLLADLDIDGAEEAGYIAAAGAHGPSFVEEDRAPWGSQMDAILATLATGEELTTTEIARRVGVSRQQVAVQLCRLRGRAHVTCVQRGVACSPAIWKRGPVDLQEWRLRNVKRLVAA